MADTASVPTAAPVESSPSLASVIGEMYGDYSDSMRAEPESDAGAPPSVTPEESGTDPGAGSPEDAPPSEPTGEPPTPADGTEKIDPASDPEALDAPIDIDPLDGATPLTYTVNGESRAFDGITVLKSGGAIIDPDALAKVQRVVGERDHLFEKSQAEYQKYADLERLTTWSSKDAQGQPITVTGRRALEERQTVMARTAATLMTYLSALNDPAQFNQFVAVLDDGNGGFSLAFDPNGHLKTLAENAAIKAEQKAREYMGHLAAPPAPATPTQADYASYAPSTIRQFEQQHQIAGLTDADRTFLGTEFPRYVVVNPDKSLAVDPRFVDVMKDRAQLRAEQKATASVATTAAATNKARLAAASVGKPGTTARAVARPKPPEPSHEQTRDADFDSFWDRQEKAAAGALKSHALGR